MKLTWKDIPGYEGKYQASTSGEIKSLSYLGHQGKEGIFKPCLNAKGYPQIVLRSKGKTRTCSVHRLIAITFLGPSKLTVNHKNGIKTDNRLKNLEYLSNTENMRHAYRTGLRTNPHSEDHGRAKLSNKDVKAIVDYPRTFGSGRTLAKQYGVSPSTISAIRSGRLWRKL